MCLLCGDIVCYLSAVCCTELPGQKPREGEVSYHTRTRECGTGLFISTDNGSIVMVDDKRSAIDENKCPYTNNLGEIFTSHSRKWDNFYMTEESGGLKVYEHYRRLYMNFGISREVI